MSDDNTPQSDDPVWRRRFDPPEPEEIGEVEEPIIEKPPLVETFEHQGGKRRFKPWFLVIYLVIITLSAISGAIIGQLVAQWASVDIEEAVRNHRQNVTTQIYDIEIMYTYG